METSGPKTRTIRLDRLTAERCAKCAPGDVLPDPKTPGLLLRGGQRGASWIFKFRSRTQIGVNGKPVQRAIGIGPLSRVSPEQARAKVREYRVELDKGRDPIGKKERRALDIAAARAKALEDESRITLAAAFPLYVKDWVRPRHKNPHKAERQLDHILECKLDGKTCGERAVVALTRQDLQKIYTQLKRRGPIQANRCIQCLGTFYGWSLNHIPGMDGRLPPTAKFKPDEREKSRKRTFSDEELVALWRAAEQLGHPVSPWFKLLVLTGLRGGELEGLRWTPEEGPEPRHGHYDPSAKVLFFPGAPEKQRGPRKLHGATKNNQEHIVHLPVMARQILLGIPRMPDGDFVFSLTGASEARFRSTAKRRMAKIVGFSNWGFHDVRRTFATRHQRLGTPSEVRDALLNHKVATLKSTYERHPYADEQRAALEAWALEVKKLISQPAAKTA